MGVRPGTPKPPGSGRKRGVLDREARQLLSGKMAAAIWKTYRELGEGWLTQLARDNPTLFCSVFLQRLLPPALKDPNEDGPLVGITFNGDPTEAARRVAFVLAQGAQSLGQDDVVAERVPYVHLAQEPAEPVPAPAPDPQREEWARQAAMTQEELLNSEDIDAHTNRRAFAESAPAPAVTQRVRTPVRLRNPRNRDDLL